MATKMGSIKTPQYLVEEVLQHSLDKYLQNGSKWIITDIKVDIPEMKGDHFVSSVKLLEITAQRNTDKKVLKRNFFVKLQSPNPAHRAQMSVTQASIKEIRFYDTIVPAMRRFCNYNIVGGNEPISIDDLIPKYLYGVYDELEDPLIIENITFTGYESCPISLQGHDLPHSELVMRALGKLHAISKAMHIKKKFADLEIERYMKDAIFSEIARGALGGFMTLSQLNYIKAVEDTAYYNEDDYNFMKNVARNMFQIGRNLMQGYEPFDVFCHGDPHYNNMMFKYASNRRPVNIKLVDFQIIRYAPLTTDLAYYFYTSTSPEHRLKYLNYLLDVYYKEFTKTLISLGITSMPFTFKELVKDFHYRAPYALFIVPWLTMMCVAPKEMFQDPNEEVEGGMFEAVLKLVLYLCTTAPYKDSIAKRIKDVYEELHNSLVQQLKLV